MSGPWAGDSRAESRAWWLVLAATPARLGLGTCSEATEEVDSRRCSHRRFSRPEPTTATSPARPPPAHPVSLAEQVQGPAADQTQNCKTPVTHVHPRGHPGVTSMAGGGEGLTGKAVSSSGQRREWGAGSRGSGRDRGAGNGRLARVGGSSQGHPQLPQVPRGLSDGPSRPAGSWGS